jgi:hypothetical protein
MEEQGNYTFFVDSMIWDGARQILKGGLAEG